jgi:hypothetical protein
MSVHNKRTLQRAILSYEEYECLICHNVSYNVDDVVKGVKRVTSVLV